MGATDRWRQFLPGGAWFYVYVNTTSMQEIDPDAIQAVKALVPLLENIDSADVAKAIIDHDKKIVPIRQEGSDYEE